MAQQPCLQVGAAVERVDDAAVFGQRHGIDGQVAPRQILFQRYVRRGVEVKAVIAGRGFALGARQCVFFLGLRVQEYRKILAYRAKAPGLHLLRCTADHHVIAVGHRQAEQLVAYCTANNVCLHQGAAGSSLAIACGSAAAAAYHARSAGRLSMCST